MPASRRRDEVEGGRGDGQPQRGRPKGAFLPRLSVGWSKPRGGAGDSDPRVFVLLSTLQNRSGTKYAVQENIERVFLKFSDQGKATLRFKNPPFDMCIKNADPLQLKTFLKVLQKIVEHKGSKEELDKIIDKECSSLKPPARSQVAKDKTSLVITNKRDYPITTNFPNLIKDLRINGINLRRFDTRILRLKCVSYLDLGDNAIPSIPTEIQTMNLRTLILRRNKISSIPGLIWHNEKFTKNLKVLDLGRNDIKVLPSSMSKLDNLSVLKMDGNLFPRLPAGLLNPNLKVLDLSSTPNLTYLPLSSQFLKLEELSTCPGTGFLQSHFVGPEIIANTLNLFPTLLDIATSKIIAMKFKGQLTEEHLPGSLIDHVHSASRCLACGRVCFASSCGRILFARPLKAICDTLTINQGQTACAKVEAILCSHKCFGAFLKSST